MSKLHDLITKLCPDGVPYRKLGEIEKDGIIKLGRGKVISKKDIANNPGSYPIYSASAINNGKFGEYGDYMFDDIRLTWSIDGGGRFFYRDDEKYSVTNVCGWLKVLDENAFNPKFLFYVLTSQWSKLVFNYTIKAHPSVIRNTYDIPMVPLPVQSEVVRILDAFTELEAELAGRKEQYAYCRNRLLSQKNLEAMDGKPVEMMKLGDVILNLRTGLNPRKNFKLNTPDATNSYITVRELDGMGFKIDQKTNKVNDAALELILKRAAIKQGDILFSGTGTIGNTALVKAAPTNWGIKEGIYAITPNAEMISQKFLIYLFHTTTCVKWFGRKAMGGAVRSVSMADLKTLSIPVPSLATQERVVDILDRFDALTTSLTDGIPAEIAMRREQYKYYRARLLDFPRLSEDSNSDNK